MEDLLSLTSRWDAPPGARSAYSDVSLPPSPGNGERLAVMPIQASFGRKSTYRAYGINGDQLASEDLGSDEEAVAWVRRLVKEGLAVGRLSREIAAGFAMDIPLQ